MSFIYQIENYYSALTETEKKIADHILKNIEKVKHQTSSELAEELKISQSSIVKFSKKIGYSGFTEFKRVLIETSVKDTVNYIHNEISVNDKPEIIIKKIAVESKNAIDSTININNLESIIEVVDKIEKAKRIFIFGIGASNLVANDFAHKLLKLNKTTIYENSSHFQVINSTLATKDDLIFSISFSGKSKEVIIASEEAKKRGATIVTLTKLTDNPLSELADIKLFSAVQEGIFRSSAISSRIAQLTMIDIIFLIYSLRDPRENLSRIKNASDLISKLRN